MQRGSAAALARHVAIIKQATEPTDTDCDFDVKGRAEIQGREGKLLNVKTLHNRWEIKAPPRRRAPLRSITETCCILLAGGLDGWQVNQQVSNN